MSACYYFTPYIDFDQFKTGVKQLGLSIHQDGVKFILTDGEDELVFWVEDNEVDSVTRYGSNDPDKILHLLMKHFNIQIEHENDRYMRLENE